MAYMNLSIFESGEKVVAQALTIDPASLYCAFEQVADGRKKKGKRSPLPRFVTLLLLGKLAGETTVSGIVDSCQRKTSVVARSIGLAQALSDQFDV